MARAPDTNAESFAQHEQVIIVSVSHYETADFQPLEGPLNNAHALRAALIDKQGSAIPESQVHSLDEKSTAGSVRSAIKTGAQRAGKEDLLIVYFCGHGVVLDDQFYLCLAETSLQNVRDTGVSGSDIDEALQGSAARGILLIIDSCRAGSLAHYAPALFRDSRQGEFRILMSSSGADEKSWDLGEKGTLFSQHLIRALNGKEPVTTSNPGFIYLSDLLRFVQQGIRQDQESTQRSGPEQIPRLVGFHAIDPLVFVHRSLTIQQISLKALKYSREYVRNRTRKLVLGAAVILIFVLGAFYTLLENHQSVRTEASMLVVYEGDPRIRFLDLPRKLRVLDLPAAAMADSSALRHEGGILRAPFGTEAAPKVWGDVRPEYGWYADSLRGHLDDAFGKLKETLAAGFEPPPFQPFSVAETLMRTRSSKKDISELREIAFSGNGRIRYLAWLGLGANGIVPDAKEVLLFENTGGFYYLGRFVNSLRGECTQHIKAFLAGVVAGSAAATFGRAYFDGVLAMETLNCKFTTPELAELRLKTASAPFNGTFRDDDLTVFSYLSNASGFRQEMMNFLTAQDPASGEETQKKIRTALSALLVDPDRVCNLNLQKFLSSPTQTHVLAAFVLFRNCGRDDDLLRQPDFRRGPSVIDLVRIGAIKQDELIDLLKKTTDSWTTSSLVRAVRLLDNVSRRDDLIAAILPMLTIDDPTNATQSSAIAALTYLHYRGEAVRPLVGDIRGQIATSAHWWLKENDPADSRRAVLNSIGTLEGLYTAGLLIDEVVLSEKERQKLIPFLRGSESEQEAAGCLLSIFGDLGEQLQVVHAADPPARNSAMTCAVESPHLQELLSTLDRQNSPDAFLVASLREQDADLKNLEARFASLPVWAKSEAAMLASWTRPVNPRLVSRANLIGPRDWWMANAPPFHN